MSNTRGLSTNEAKAYLNKKAKIFRELASTSTGAEKTHLISRAKICEARADLLAKYIPTINRALFAFYERKWEE